MLESAVFTTLVERFSGPQVRALVLMGSHARGTAGPYSDVDLVRIMAGVEPPLTADGSYSQDGRLLVASSVTPAQVEKWFSRPEVAVEVIAGLRVARALQDDGTFATIQARAADFHWDAAMQDKANRWASERMVGWIEEVNKGLEGLRRADTGRLLNARFGLSWGVTRVAAVQRGVLLSGDNALYAEVGQAMRDYPEWLHLRRLAFGIEDEEGVAPVLAEQVRAGLRLYALTAGMLDRVLHRESAPLVRGAVALIQASLG
jgi:hypothetical protein